MKIAISVGHSILKSGACTSADGTALGGGNEYKFCSEFAPFLKKALEKNGHEVTIIEVPKKSVSSVSEEKKYKVSKYNSQKFDLNIELHLNAASATAEGTETLYKSEKGKKYADAIINKLGEIYKPRGAKKRSDLYFLNTTKATAVLVELFFCTNKAEWKKAQKNKRKMARLITEAIASVK